MQIKTPLTYGDAESLARRALALNSGFAVWYPVVKAFLALDVASRQQAREDYHMYPPPVDTCCAACSAKPALVQIVDSERQMRTYFCSLSCAQGYDFARGDAQRREWAQMEQGE